MKKRALTLLLATTLLFTACSKPVQTSTEKTTYTFHTLQFEVESDLVVEQTPGTGFLDVYLDETQKSSLQMVCTSAHGFAMSTSQAKAFMYVLLQNEGTVNTEGEITETTIGGTAAWAQTANITITGTEQANYTVWLFVESDTIYIIMYVSPPADTAKYLPKIEDMINSMRFVEATAETYTSSFGVQFALKDEWRVVDEETTVWVIFNEQATASLEIITPLQGNPFDLSTEMLQKLADDIADSIEGDTIMQEINTVVINGRLTIEIVIHKAVNGVNYSKTTYWVISYEDTFCFVVYGGAWDAYDFHYADAEFVVNSLVFADMNIGERPSSLLEVNEATGEVTVHGMQFNLEESWQTEAVDEMVYVWFSQEKPGYAFVFAKPFALGAAFEEDRAALHAASFVQSVLGAGTVTSIAQSSINANDAWVAQLDITGADGNPAKATLWMFERDGYVYTYMYVAQPNIYDEYFPYAQRIMGTVEFIG